MRHRRPPWLIANHKILDRFQDFGTVRRISDFGPVRDTLVRPVGFRTIQ